MFISKFGIGIFVSLLIFSHTNQVFEVTFFSSDIVSGIIQLQVWEPFLQSILIQLAAYLSKSIDTRKEPTDCAVEDGVRVIISSVVSEILLANH